MEIEVKIPNSDGQIQGMPINTFNLHTAGYTAVYVKDGTEVRPGNGQPPTADNSAQIKALYDAGKIKFVKFENYAPTNEKVDITTSSTFSYKYDTSDDASAKTAYDRAMYSIQSQDKILEMRLRQLTL
jgi:hypothetical protein